MIDLLVVLAYSRGITFFDYNTSIDETLIEADSSDCVTCEVILNTLLIPGQYSIDFLKSVTKVVWQEGLNYQKLKTLCPNAMVVFEDLLTGEPSKDIQIRIEPFSVIAIVDGAIIDLNQVDVADSLEIVKFCKAFSYGGNEVTALERYMRLV